MICDDTSAQTFLDIVFKGRSPFSGKSPGAGWSLLSASSIDGQMSDDPDGRFKPFSFLPLARAKGESLDLFGVRLVPGVVQPCVWSRGRRSLVDCSSIVSLDQLSRPLALDHVRQFTKSFYGELSNGPTPANRGDDFLSICVEPLSPRLEATTRECCDWVISNNEPFVKKLFGGKVIDSWDYNSWLLASKRSDLGLNIRYRMMENACASVLYSSTSLNRLVGYLHCDISLMRCDDVIRDGALFNDGDVSVRLFRYMLRSNVMHCRMLFLKAHDKLLGSNDGHVNENYNFSVNEFIGGLEKPERDLLRVVYGNRLNI